MENTKQIKAHDYKEIYEALGYNLSKLGCLMLDIEPFTTSYYEIMQDGTSIYFPGYKSKNKDRFWIDGYVADKTPHLTLFYGFLQSAQCYKWHIGKLLKDTVIDSVIIEDIGYFESPYEDEKYYCIVGHIKKTTDILEAHDKMTLLPNIQTFVGYKPHVTIAYIVYDSKIRDEFIAHLKKELVGKALQVKGLNYGK